MSSSGGDEAKSSSDSVSQAATPTAAPGTAAPGTPTPANSAAAAERLSALKQRLGSGSPRPASAAAALGGGGISEALGRTPPPRTSSASPRPSSASVPPSASPMALPSVVVATAPSSSSPTAGASSLSPHAKSAASFASRLLGGLPGASRSANQSATSIWSTHSDTPAPTPQPAQDSPDMSCPCHAIINANDPRRCARCGGNIKPVVRLAQEKAAVETQLDETRKRLDAAMLKQEESVNEMTRIRFRNERLEQTIEKKQEELMQLKHDLEMISDKLIDEIEKRAEIQHSKDTIQDDLEELTASLFLEANTMVADRSRQLHEFQLRSEATVVELEATRRQLQMEQAQMRELRIRLGHLEEQHEQLVIEYQKNNQQLINKSAAQARPLSVYTIGADRIDRSKAHAEAVANALIDPQQFSQFQEFLQSAAKLKPNKLHSLVFMRNALEDDVTPCLRFSGNTRTSARKFIDAIQAQVCFVEEMTEEYIAELHAQEEQAAAVTGSLASMGSFSQNASTDMLGPTSGDSGSASAAASISPPPKSGAHSHSKESLQSLEEIPTAPTRSLFDKSVLERLTSALTQAAGSPLGGNLDIVMGGLSFCSTCSRNDTCRHHFKITDISEDTWYPICINCRNRLSAVCEFYSFVRHVRQGLYSTRMPEDLYREALRLKRLMFYARINASQFIDDGDVFAYIQPVRPNSALVSFYDATPSPNPGSSVSAIMPLSHSASSTTEAYFTTGVAAEKVDKPLPRVRPEQMVQSPVQPQRLVSVRDDAVTPGSSTSDVPLAQLRDRMRVAPVRQSVVNPANIGIQNHAIANIQSPDGLDVGGVDPSTQNVIGGKAHDDNRSDTMSSIMSQSTVYIDSTHAASGAVTSNRTGTRPPGVDPSALGIENTQHVVDRDVVDTVTSNLSNTTLGVDQIDRNKATTTVPLSLA